jgi:DNA-binding MarR family transcriptional regulator
VSRRRAMPGRFKDVMRQSDRNWEASAAAVSILRADSKVAQVIERALAEADLTLPQFNVLMELASSPGSQLPLYELTSRLTSTAPNVSWLSNRMEDRRLVRKKRAAHDSRVVLLELTERGWATIERAAPLVFACEKELFADYTKDELKTLSSLLTRLL